MTFSDIHILWLVWSVPFLFLVCLYGIRKRVQVLRRFSSSKGLAAIVPDASAARHWVKIGLVLTALLLMIISWAGPQYGYHWQEIQRKGVDVIIALDCSRSMLAKDISPTRLDRAKREVFDLLGMLQGDRVGLVAFAGTAFLQCPLTLDYEAFYLFLNTLSPDFLPMGGTNLAAAVSTAVSGFKKEDASEKAIILITDGEETDADAEAAAEAAAQVGIKLFCIGVGGEDGVPIPTSSGGYIKDQDGNIILSRLDASTLKRMAAVSGGAYVRSVAGDMDLDVIYAKHIRGEMDLKTLANQKKKVLENRYQWFLTLAVLALLIERFLPFKKGLVLGILVIVMSIPGVGSASQLKESLNHGMDAYEAGEYDKAENAFIDAQLLAPEKPEIYYNLGNAQYKAGKYEAAIKNYEQALGSENESLRQKTHYNMGNAYFRKGQLDDAIKQYEAAITLDAKDHQAKENLEYVKELKAKQPPASSQKDSNESDKTENDQQKETPDQKQDGQQNEDTSDKKSSNSQKQDENEPSQDPAAGSSSQDNREQEKKENEDNVSGEQQGALPKEQPDTSDSAGMKSASSNTKTDDVPHNDPSEKMLNRLKDIPGRALMPNYQKQQVDKDW